MSELLKWLASNPSAAIIAAILFGVIVLLAILIYITAFLQGREISFWPPKIGSKPDKTIKASKGSAGIEILGMKKAFPEHITQKAKEAKKFILDTDLNQEVRRIVSSSHQDEYRRIRDERVMKGELAFRRVVVIFTKEQFESVLRNILRFKGHEYFVRYYDPPPKAIPILHVMSFDGEHFYLGGFYSSGAATEERAVYIQDKFMNELLQEYWHMLWLRATPLNERGNINWEELKKIGERVGVINDDFDKLIKKMEEEVQNKA